MGVGLQQDNKQKSEKPKRKGGREFLDLLNGSEDGEDEGSHKSPSKEVKQRKMQRNEGQGANGKKSGKNTNKYRKENT